MLAAHHHGPVDKAHIHSTASMLNVCLQLLTLLARRGRARKAARAQAAKAAATTSQARPQGSTLGLELCKTLCLAGWTPK
jgi:hypothetical protein